MPSFTGIVSLPPSKNVPTFNSPNFNTATQSLTYGDALKSFLAYPQAQGKEQLVDTDVSGTLQLFGDLSIVGTGNYIQFPDATQQTTAFIEANYAQLNTDNTFLSPFTNTFQGTNASNGLTAPIIVSNSQTTNKASFYIDDANNLDFTLYSNQADGGMTIRNAGGNSFTVAPLAPNNTATFSNPISCGSQTLTCGSITINDGAGNTSVLSTTASGLNVADPLTSTQLTLSSGGNTSLLTTTATGLNVADPIVSTGQITGNNFLVAPAGQDPYSIYSNSTGGYGLVVANTSGGVGTLTLSNNSTTLTTLSSTTNGLVVNDPLTATSLTLSSGGNTTVMTTTGTGLNIADSITTLNSVNAGSLNATSGIFTTSGDLFIGGETTLASGSNLSGTSIAAAGLYFGRNLEVGQNEFDIIAYNPTTANYLNIYGSNTTAISQASVPIISLANGTAYLNGNQIATTSQIVGSYTVGQIITGIFTTVPTGFLLCNGQNIPTTSYPQLYALIGTAYNAYNANVPGGNYSMPNLVSSVPIGANSTINEYGTNIPSYTDSAIINNAQGGNNLQTSFLSHTHTVNTYHNHGYANGTTNVANGTGGGSVPNISGSGSGNYQTLYAQPATATGNAGGNNVSNISQFLAVYYYIYGGTP
jgi:microcystin-dependent protein